MHKTFSNIGKFGPNCEIISIRYEKSGVSFFRIVELNDQRGIGKLTPVGDRTAQARD